MAERPIIFSGPMVRAILEGSKTQTRRVIKMQPQDPFETASGAWLDHLGVHGQIKERVKLRWQTGDTLWVREAINMGHDGLPIATCSYAADGYPVDLRPNPFWAGDQIRNIIPSIHMPRWTSRITLKVTSVKVERLQDISEEDAKAEGIAAFRSRTGLVPCTVYGHDPEAQNHAASAREAFAYLWQSINGPDSWDANPWVAAISLERVK